MFDGENPLGLAETPGVKMEKQPVRIPWSRMWDWEGDEWRISELTKIQ